MWSFLTSAEMAPFSGALLLLLGLLVLELIALFSFGSLFGMEVDGPEAEFDFDADLDIDAADLGASDIGEVDLDAAEAASGAASAGGPLAWLGVGEAPLILWIAGVAASYGLSGYALQLAAISAFGAALPAALAAAVCVIPGLWGGRLLARTFGRLIPKTETTAVSRRHLGGRVGVITVGTATQGNPAQARVRDRHGETHYIRVEPREAGVAISQGASVIVFRPVNGIYPVIPLDD